MADGGQRAPLVGGNHVQQAQQQVPWRRVDLQNLQNKVNKKIFVVGFLATVATLASISAALGLGIAGMSRNTEFTSYERMGNSECSNVSGTSLIYKGFIAGFQTANDATTFKCLPLDKAYISYQPTSDFNGDPLVQQVNVAEYRTFIPGKNASEAVCAVCNVEGRGSIQMLAASIECIDSSWTKEYDGYLMTDEIGTTFVCVDEQMGVISNTDNPEPSDPTLNHISVPRDLGGKGNSIKNDYDTKKVLSCVVCSK